MFSEMDLKRVLNAINSGIYVCDENLSCVYCNEAYEWITGNSKEDLLGMTPARVVGEGLASNSVATLSAEKRCKVSLVQTFPNKRTALVTAIPVFSDNSENSALQWVIITAVDITAQNKLYEHLMATSLMDKKNEVLLKKIIGKNIVRESAGMQEVIARSLRAGFSDVPVIITGETGTGKEIVANIIHENSGRSGYEMIKINCGAIPPELAEAELFGYSEGAFTGAKRGGQAGIFEMANHGTVFLDEIGELPLSLQAKLLRVLQEHEIRRVGSAQTYTSDFRVIAATNQNLRALVSQGKFRSDLYYRINVIDISVPPLRQRREDILPLIHMTLADLNERYARNVFFSPRALKFFEQYSWPGNVRELKNMVERLFFLQNPKSDQVSFEDVSAYADMSLESGVTEERDNTESKLEILSLKERLKSYEIALIREALQECPTMRDAAQKLQIDPATLTRKCQMYQINN